MVELRREVGVEERGSDEGGVDEEEERRGVSEPFTPRLLIPLLKGLCSIMPDSFRK